MQKPITLFLHGFNEWDKGQGSVGEFRSFFAELGMPYYMLRYGHFGFWDTATKNDNIARQVAEFVKNSERPVIIVAFSNGAAITCLAVNEYGAKPHLCVFINPALRKDIVLCPNLRYKVARIRPDQVVSTLKSQIIPVDIWHSPSDGIVKLSKLTKYLPITLVKTILEKTNYRPWGEMGASGSIYADKFYVMRNINKEEKFPVVSSEHADVFSPGKISYFGPLIARATFDRFGELVGMGVYDKY